MDIVLAILAASAFLAALVLAIGRIAARSGARRGRSGAGDEAQGPRTCPLCSSILSEGERVKSKLFPGKGDRIMHILGCPRCWPATPSMRRICPVCGRELSREGWAVARFFERPGGLEGVRRAHIHVLGCTECRR